MSHEIVGLKTGLVLWALDLDDSHKHAVQGSVWNVTMGHLEAVAKEEEKREAATGVVDI